MCFPPRLEAALSSWSQWLPPYNCPPQVVCRFRGGLTNRSYLIDCGGNKAVVRLNNPDSGSLGIARDTEHEILRALAPFDLAPRPLFFSREFCVIEYISGRLWTRGDFRLGSQRQRLHSTIAQYQRVALEIEPFNYAECLENYWRQFSRYYPKRARKQRHEWKRFIARLNRYEGVRALTHHDLQPQNIIEKDKKIYIIDWEYAGLGFKTLDHCYVTEYIQKITYNCKTSTPVLRLAPSTNERLVSELIYWLHELWWAIRIARDSKAISLLPAY